MYERMLGKYRVLFEGMPEPVFYKYFYPIYNNTTPAHWDLFWLTRGLKREVPHADEKFGEYHGTYLGDLRELLNAAWADTGGSGKRHGVATVPSSSVDVTNRVTELTREMLARNPEAYTDLTDVVVRTHDKESAHGGGGRFVEENVATLAVTDPVLLQSLDSIVVIDDVVTTGNSFRAIDRVLRDAGFRGQLINFAFSFTRPSDSIEYYLTYDADINFEGLPRVESLRGDRVEKPERRRSAWLVFFDDGTQRVFDGDAQVVKRAGYRKVQMDSGAFRAQYDPGITLRFSTGDEVDFRDVADVRANLKNAVCAAPIEGIVFDLDQTLLDDAVREEGYERRGAEGAWSPYQTYDGVRELMELGLPFAIVSNRPERQLANLLGAEGIKTSIFPLAERSDSIDAERDGSARKRSESVDSLDARKVFVAARALPENVFSYSIVDFGDSGGGGGRYNLYKPCPDSVRRALGYLRRRIEAGGNARIIGIGNSQEDIIAYNAAGIESALALWGVPEYLREHAAHRWGADYVFGNVREFARWCEDGGPLDFRGSRVGHTP